MKFVDMGGHAYAVVTATTNALEAEFVCIPRPLEHSERADGGPLRYRIRSRTGKRVKLRNSKWRFLREIRNSRSDREPLWAIRGES
jgi:hypothetical protein